MAAIEPATAPGTDVVGTALRTVLRFCGVQLAYVSEFREGVQVVRRTAGDPGTFGIEAGRTFPLEDTYCQRHVDGRLPGVVADTLAEPSVAGLPQTRRSGLRAYVGAPIRTPDGVLLGSLCGISSRPLPELGAEHADLVALVARVVGAELLGSDDRASELARSQNEFLATVSHDLRTPLRAVSFIAEDLADGDADLEPEPAARMILEEVDHVMELVDDVLLVARQRAGATVLEPAEVDLGEVLGGALRTCATAAGPDGGRLRLELPGEPLRARADGPRVAQAVRNLLDNALKYSAADQPVVLRARRDDTTVVIEVQDRGIGVAADEVGRLGTTGFRATTALHLGVDGLGLGLASAQAVAEAHEGTLSVRSRPGRGSVFRIRLPLRGPAVPDPPA